MMKKLLYGALVLLMLGLSACVKENKPDEAALLKAGLTGVWELTSVSTKATVGSVTVNVYIDFQENGSFQLYQKIGDGRYTRFTGTYAVGENKTLSGTYAGGASWGPYEASLTDLTLTLSPTVGTEVDTYRKIETLPASVTSSLY